MVNPILGIMCYICKSISCVYSIWWVMACDRHIGTCRDVVWCCKLFLYVLSKTCFKRGGKAWFRVYYTQEFKKRIILMLVISKASIYKKSLHYHMQCCGLHTHGDRLAGNFDFCVFKLFSLILFDCIWFCLYFIDQHTWRLYILSIDIR